MNEEFQIGTARYPVQGLTPEEEEKLDAINREEQEKWLQTPAGLDYAFRQAQRAAANLPQPEPGDRDEESYGDQLEALEQKLDDLLTFMARLTPLVEFAEKMMLTTTKKEKLKLFMGMGSND